MIRKLLLFSVLLTIPCILIAGPGKIAGKVTDKTSGEPLVGVNILIVGTSMGAASGIDGNYFILNVQPGTYTLRASYVGYREITISNVKVSADYTTEVNFGMLEESIELKEVQIVAERPLIQKDYTNTVRTQSYEEIINLPIRGAVNVVGIQASVVQDEGSNNLYIRGGRPNEVAYFVDGVAVNNPLAGTGSASFANLNTNAIEELQVQTGGFNAEYGSVMSGLVSLTTRQARANYFGSLEAITDNLIKPGDKYFNNYTSFGYNVYNATFGGPIIPGKDQLTIFLAAERQFLRDNDPRAIGGVKPNSSLSSWNLSGKLSARPTPQIQLLFGGYFYGRSGNNWDNFRRFRAWENHQRFDNATYSGYFKFTHNLDPSTFYTAQFSYFREDLKAGDGRWFDNLLAYGDTAINPYLTSQATNPGAVYSTIAPKGHVLDRFTKSKSEYIGLTGDLTSQQGNHLLKIGGEYRYYIIRRFTVNPMGLAIGVTSTAPDALWRLYRGNNVEYYGYSFDGTSEVSGEDDFFENNAIKANPKEGPKHPVYGAFYLQDKIEYSDLVLNIGARLDYFNANEKVFKDINNPYGERGTPGGGVLTPDDLEDSKSTITVSPRLGFSFPITDRAVFHAQYGVFLAQPPLQYILSSKTWLNRMIVDAPFSTKIPNPNLKPEKTVAYEFGFRQMITDLAAISITAFYKEVKDLIQSRNVAGYPNGYETYINTDYGTVKGFDIIFELRRTKNISATVNYTLSYAMGTGSDPLTQSRIAWIQTEHPKLISPLDFDRRHNGSVNLDYRLGVNEGPKFGDIYPFEKFGINALFAFNSGVPYTQSIIYNPFFGGVTEIRPTGGINQAYTPWNFRLDLKIDRTFNFRNLSANIYIWWINVLNSENVFAVYRGTGEPNNSGWLSTREGIEWAQLYGQEAVEIFKGRENNPANYGLPGQMRFGIRIYY